jgi:solute carrier family 9B (sodium/hydrogen exchanger), member 1/2
MGILGGWGMVVLFKRIHMRDTVKVLLIFGVSFIFVTLEIVLKSFFPVSGLIAVMALGCTILKQNEVVAKRLKGKFSKIWVAAEMILFVLVGAAVDITVVSTIGIVAVALVLLSLVFRTLGVHLSLTKTTYTWKEKLFCSIAYLPKATVQAAIGAYPLAMGLSSGSLILGVAVVAIFVTAPLGAIGIDHSYKKLLSIS